jgi:hypothetical protein
MVSGRPSINFLELPGSFSQAGQESFAYWITKKSGYYLEIGAGDPKLGSNTFLLETQFGWNGLSLELDDSKCRKWRSLRRNPVFNYDATKVNYREFLRYNGAPKRIDYLQVDIEPAKYTFLALIKAIVSGHVYSVITFEHDVYVSWKNRIYQILAFYFLRLKGYSRIVKNVRVNGKPFEDWYVFKDITW